MPRLVSVWLPAWPIDRLARLRRRAGRAPPWQGEDQQDMPFALVESGVHGLTLTAVNAQAWREGLRPGIRLADARAALPSLATASAEPDADAAALAALALWAGRYGPARNVEGSDGLWIDTSGVAHLFDGERSMLEDLSTRLARTGIAARIGLADTAGAAFAVARFAATRARPFHIVPLGLQREALADLPVAALRLPADAVILLQRLGLVRIGQLYGLPREALARRFRDARPARSSRRTGAASPRSMEIAGNVLSRLDQAIGLMPEPRAPLSEPPCHLARRLFAEPLVSMAGVEAAISDLAQDLTRLLEARCEGGTRFLLELFLADGSAQAIRIGASRPCRDPSHLISLLAAKLDTVDAGFGIDAMALSCTHAEPLAASQIALAVTTSSARSDDAPALLDRLSNRLGALRVFRLTASASHVPERAQRRVPILARAQGETAIAPHPLRPILLLERPEPIRVLAEVPDGPPRHFTWRRISRRILRAQGPERIEPEWWRAIGRHPPSTGPPQSLHLDRPRDYYGIEDEHGGRYWVFRAGLYSRSESTECDEGETQDNPEPVWFMHGLL